MWKNKAANGDARLRIIAQQKKKFNQKRLNIKTSNFRTPNRQPYHQKTNNPQFKNRVTQNQRFNFKKISNPRFNLKTKTFKMNQFGNTKTFKMNQFGNTKTFKMNQFGNMKNKNQVPGGFSLVRTVKNYTRKPPVRSTQGLRNQQPPMRMDRIDEVLDMSSENQASYLRPSTASQSLTGSVQSRLGPQIMPQHKKFASGVLQVTNLHPTTVSRSDIVELFSSIGPLKAIQMSTPGAAIVTFINHEDAILAVDSYHNRSLDGQPMQCRLSASYL